MNLRSGIFMIVAFVACLFAAESSAQIIPRGNGQLAFRAARSYASRAIPGVGVGRIVQSGIRNTGNQFGGNQFGGNGLPAGRLIQVGRLISRF